MKSRVTFATLLAFGALSGAAQAEVFASGPVYGGPASVGGFANCRIFNYGASTVTISSRQLRTNTNVLVAPSSDTCNVALAPGNYCAFVAPIAGNFAYTCRVIATGTDVRLSGAAEIQNSGFAVLNTLPILP